MATDFYTPSQSDGVHTVEVRAVDKTGNIGNAGSVNIYIDSSVQPGKWYKYLLGVVLTDNSEIKSQIVEIRTTVPKLTLYQNHPNPFNPTTKLPFIIPERAFVNLAIYNVEGKLVITIVNEVLDGGYKEYVWDGKNAAGYSVSTGIYFYRLRTGKNVMTKKMVLLR